jgi:peptide/nickel transport system permease protein
MSRSRSDLLLGGTVIALVAGGALLAPLLAPRDPLEIDLAARLLPPGGSHPLGTDELGREVLSRLLYGARGSLAVALPAALLATTAGLFAAAIGRVGGRLVDGIVFRFADLLLAFPGTLLAVTLAALLGPGRIEMVIALSASGWVGVARLARGEMIRWGTADFVTAARACGAGEGRILVVHLLPQILPLVAAQGVLLVAGFVLSEGALSFLGLGLPPPFPSWGGMLDAARGHLLDAPHLALFPALALGLAMAGLGLLGDGLVSRIGGRER